MVGKRSAGYRIYLCSVWDEHGEGPSGRPKLRFSLEDPRTGKRRGFASIEALAAALEPDVTDHARRDSKELHA